MLKRKREPVFTTSEKHVLIDLVEEHYHILENKKTDATTVRSKNEEWQKIAIKFNAASSIRARDSSTLKMCWENLKKKVKQQQTQKNQHFIGTGGGPPKKFDYDPVAERVLSLIKSRITGYVNPLDSDDTHVLDESDSPASSRRRPLLRHNINTASRRWAQERINTLCMDNEQAGEQHELQMQILRLQQQREQVMLEQERVELQILKFKLNKLRD